MERLSLPLHRVGTLRHVKTSREHQRRLFAEALRTAMRRGGVTHAELTRRLGRGSVAMVGQWTAGLCLPRLAQAEQISDCLARPDLLQLVVRARSVVCRGCGVAFVNDSSRARAFHSPLCRRRRRAESAAASTSDLRRIQAAVAAMCQSCEPEGTCAMAACALRSVSPLPLRSALRLVG